MIIFDFGSLSSWEPDGDVWKKMFSIICRKAYLKNLIKVFLGLKSVKNL